MPAPKAVSSSRRIAKETVRSVGTLLVVPDQFRNTALSFPAKVDAALKLVETPAQGKRMLDNADALSHFARRVKADTEIQNAIGYGKLKIIDRLGELLPATPRKQTGRGKKKTITANGDTFPLNTASRFRRVHKHAEKIDEYFKSCSNGEELTTGGFIRFATGTEKAGTSAHVSANTGIPEWYTPVEYIDAARIALGNIDLDPASSDIAQKTIAAKTYYTIDDDGLEKRWLGNVWMNPPYTAELVQKFIGKLLKHFPHDVSAAIVLVNNATETKWFQAICRIASAVCFPAGRVKFLDENGKPGAPLQGQAVIYLGNDPDAFDASFSSFGFCARISQ